LPAISGAAIDQRRTLFAGTNAALGLGPLNVTGAAHARAAAGVTLAACARLAGEKIDNSYPSRVPTPPNSR